MDNNEKNANVSVQSENDSPKAQKVKRLHNQFMLKKGAYSIAVIALVLAALILFNWLVSTLSGRFHLEFDMTPEKLNSLSDENKEFIEKIEDKITITVCSAEYNYSSNLSTLTENYMGIYGGDYYERTLELLKQYEDYNDNISIVFIDPTSGEFDAIRKNYPDENLFYGDMIVTNDKNSRYKVVSFEDIYEYDSQSAGYGAAEVTGNNLETALTSAIANCVAEKNSKIAVITGHSGKDYSSSLTELLELYNYKIDVLGNKIITSIDSEYDLVLIMAPSTDFSESEIDVLNEFLKSDGSLSKGILYFADPLSPELPNLKEFLAQWGITVNEGILFETYKDNYISGDPTQLVTYPVNVLKDYGIMSYDDSDFDDSMLSGLSYFITGYNSPLETGKATAAGVKVNPVCVGLPTSVIAPVGVSADWDGYSDDDLKQYCAVIESKSLDYNADNDEVTRYVYAFSSVEFVESNWAEMSGISNKEIVLACINRACGVKDSGVNFIKKSVTNETFVSSEEAANRVRVVFKWALPLIIIAISIFVYIKRRNA